MSRSTIPAWLATAGGMTVLVAATLWIPTVVTVATGLAVLALSALVLYQAATRTGTGGGHGLAGLVTAALGLLLVGLLGMPGVASDTSALDLRWARRLAPNRRHPPPSRRRPPSRSRTRASSHSRARSTRPRSKRRRGPVPARTAPAPR